MEIFLSDKQIPDLETLDDVLLEVLQLEQLRIDMEAIRDDLIHQYRQYQEDDDQQGTNIIHILLVSLTLKNSMKWSLYSQSMTM